MISKMCIMSPSAVAFPRGEQSPHKPHTFHSTFTALSRHRGLGISGYVSRIYAPLRTCGPRYQARIKGREGHRAGVASGNRSGTAHRHKGTDPSFARGAKCNGSIIASARRIRATGDFSEYKYQ